MICAACRDVIDGKEKYLRCVIESCSKSYHIACAGGNVFELDISWICPECRCSTKKGGDNSCTPVGSAKKARENVTVRKIPPATHPVDDSFVAQPSELSIDEVQCLRLEIQSLKSHISHAVSLLKSYELKMSDYAIEIKELHKKLDAVAISSAFGQPSPADKSWMDNMTASSPPSKAHTSTQSQSNEALSALEAPLDSEPNKREQKKVINKANHNKLSLFTNTTAGSPQAQSYSTNQQSEVTTVTTEGEAASATNHQVSDSGTWTEVRKRKHLRPVSLCGKANPAKTSLKAVEPRKYIHLWNMESNAEE
ncbi:hypothetical protein ABMA28_009866, partial [Loxostege sticticalis]